MSVELPAKGWWSRESTASLDPKKRLIYWTGFTGKAKPVQLCNISDHGAIQLRDDLRGTQPATQIGAYTAGVWVNILTRELEDRGFVFSDDGYTFEKVHQL